MASRDIWTCDIWSCDNSNENYDIEIELIFNNEDIETFNKLHSYTLNGPYLCEGCVEEINADYPEDKPLITQTKDGHFLKVNGIYTKDNGIGSIKHIGYESDIFEASGVNLDPLATLTTQTTASGKIIKEVQNEIN